MRRYCLFALLLCVMLPVLGYAQTEQEKGELFFSAGFENGFFFGRKLPLLPDVLVDELSFLKVGGYWEKPKGSGSLALGLETGYSGGGFRLAHVVPLILSGAYTFSPADLFSFGPSLKLGAYGVLNEEWFKIIPLVGARLEAELRYRGFPISLYGTGGVDFFPRSMDFLPVAEVGLRFRRADLAASERRSTAAGAGASGGQGAAAAGAGAAVAGAGTTAGAGAAGQASLGVGTGGAGTGTAAGAGASGGQGAAAAGTSGAAVAGAGTTAGAGTAVGAGAAGGAGATALVQSPAITAVNVTPSFTMVTKGQTQQFGATVSGNNNPAQTVTWAVLGGGNGTSINSNGLLSVAPNENATSLIVRATSTVDPSRSGTAAVAAITPASTPPVPASPTSSGAGTASAGTGAAAAGTGTAGTGTASAAGTGAAAAGTGTAGTGTASAAGTGTAGAAATAQRASGSAHQLFFRAVYFEPDSAVLLESSRLIIEGVGHQLQVDPTLRVILRSYTAPFGTAAGREIVSESRKNFCRDYLVQQYGVNPSRITTESWASERIPEYATGTEWGTYRCVEFIVSN